MQHWDFASNLSEASRSNLTVMFLCRKLLVVVVVGCWDRRLGWSKRGKKAGIHSPLP